MGSRAEADRWQDDDTIVTDLGERALLPGFVDAHGHLSFMAQTINFANVASPPVGPVGSISALQKVLRDYLKEGGFQADEWIIGMGYDDSLLEEQRHPDRDDLDAVTKEHPLALIHVSGHLAAVNSRALEIMALNSDTPDPAGGLIRRRTGSSEPNGVLEETAARPVQRYAFAPSKNPATDVARALATYASFGITTVQDGASSLPIYQMLKKLASERPFDLDVVIYPMAQEDTFVFPQNVDTRAYVNGLKLGGIKLSLDGSPQGKTAYLSRPYLIPPEGKTPDYRGYPTMEQETVNALVAKYLDQGVQILAHANGDAAADMLLDAIREAAKGKPLGDHRTVMIHAQTVREDQLDVMAELAVIPSYFSAHSYFWGDWHRDSVLGEARASRISPTRSTLERGMHFTIHNDTPIVPPNMIRLIWATVNRLTRSAQVLGEAQRISALDAIRATTSDAAYQYFEEGNKGTLTPGKQADLVILSKDPTEVAAEEII
ncbi:MAG: amidohydrolase, partial [Pseudomonadales bacterium]